MALGTFISRLTGLIRLLALAYALGAGPAADAFNLANTTPNIFYDIVLGGILGATFIPVFARVLTEKKEAGWESVSSIITVSGLVLILSCIILEILAPYVIKAYDFDYAHISIDEFKLAVDLFRFFIPQILFYGFFAIATSLLNLKNKFGLPAFAPIVNNLISTGVLIELALVVKNVTPGYIISDFKLLFLLGIGTTAGVAAQFLVLIASFFGQDFKISFKINLKDQALQEIIKLSGWSFGFVILNQLALFIVLALATKSGVGSVSAYTYAYIFFQLPYGIIAVSYANAITPKLARLWVLNKVTNYVKVLSNGIKSTLSLVIPSAVLYLILAQPISYLLLFKNHLNNRGIYLTSESLKMLALGLPGFCLYMLVVRGFQTMRNARIVFVLYLIENSLNIVLAFLLAPKMGIKGICLSISIAYTVGFVIGALILRIKSGSFKKQKPIAHAIKILLSSVLAGLFASFGSALFGSTGALYNLLNLILGLGLGIVGFFLGALILSGWRT